MNKGDKAVLNGPYGGLSFKICKSQVFVPNGTALIAAEAREDGQAQILELVTVGHASRVTVEVSSHWLKRV